ncbi:MAG TPA: hypothetical protein VMG31_13135 [Verrucomicrobiae bacterium]|nr:hypothetical protein [Verrucomicrobiae bacterium]
MKIRVLAVTLLALVLAVPAFGKTYKTIYPVPCSDLWNAVKDTLANPANNYEVAAKDDTQMHADYDVKHAAHVTVTGVFLQRQNHVTLVSKGAAICELQVVSNFSGWEHSDRGDFKKRVDESLEKLKNPPAPPAQPAEPTPPVK